MFSNPGKVWASAKTPSNAILKAAEGDDVLYIPHRMAPTGSDFSSMTGGTMIRYAQSNMDPSTIKQFDAVMSDINPTWPGLSATRPSRRSRPCLTPTERQSRAPWTLQFRNQGGLNIGEARLSIADPRQVNARAAS